MSINITVALSYHCCPTCSIHYAIPKDLADRRQRDGGDWYCPNGHKVRYTTPEIVKVREQLEREKRCCESQRARAANLEEQVEHQERRVRGYQGALAKAKKRATPAQQ